MNWRTACKTAQMECGRAPSSEVSGLPVREVIVSGPPAVDFLRRRPEGGIPREPGSGEPVRPAGQVVAKGKGVYLKFKNHQNFQTVCGKMSKLAKLAKYADAKLPICVSHAVSFGTLLRYYGTLLSHPPKLVSQVQVATGQHGNPSK